METGTSGTGNNAYIDVCQRIVNHNYEAAGESSVSTSNCGLPIINQYYLSINDIKILLGISQSTAKKVFEKADELDDKKIQRI